MMNWINIGSGTNLLPDGDKSLREQAWLLLREVVTHVRVILWEIHLSLIMIWVWKLLI